MAKKPYNHDDDPETVDPKADLKATEGVTHVPGPPIHSGPTVEDRIVTNPVAPNEPYPTGNPQIDHEALREYIHPHFARDRAEQEQRDAHSQKAQKEAEAAASRK
jgi:hypothetical protein